MDYGGREEKKDGWIESYPGQSGEWKPWEPVMQTNQGKLTY